jgi:hypothetical protein
MMLASIDASTNINTYIDLKILMKEYQKYLVYFECCFSL